jgi:hypothetical protein
MRPDARCESYLTRALQINTDVSSETEERNNVTRKELPRKRRNTKSRTCEIQKEITSLGTDSAICEIE